MRRRGGGESGSLWHVEWSLRCTDKISARRACFPPPLKSTVHFSSLSLPLAHTHAEKQTAAFQSRSSCISTRGRRRSFYSTRPARTPQSRPSSSDMPIGGLPRTKAPGARSEAQSDGGGRPDRVTTAGAHPRWEELGRRADAIWKDATGEAACPAKRTSAVA